VSRFEQSFMFHMIRDFFLLLLVVAGAELGIRYGVVLYEFRNQEPERVDRAAQQLASDIKSIMLNSGGPTAAQTVYPILNRNYDDLGLAIAVVPAEVTIESMKATRNMVAQGLRAVWPAGNHNEATVKIKAEQFCLGCHVKAQVGEVLGTVTVRSYLSRKEDAWWHEVRLTAVVLSFNIIVHTIVLFLLLKVRMEPLLSLRSTVTGLAKGVMDLSPRARVKSDDEFGELALDLNHFLDRIGLIVRDLDKILSEVVAVGARLNTLTRHLDHQFDGMRASAQRATAESAQRSLAAQVATARESGAFAVLVQTLDELSERVPTVGGAELRTQLGRLQGSFASVQAALHEVAPPLGEPTLQSAESQAFAQSLREMALLEATMQKVAESGQQVLQRLLGAKPPTSPKAG
jgi:methyl-accepting chemotaxis protein